MDLIKLTGCGRDVNDSGIRTAYLKSQTDNLLTVLNNGGNVVSFGSKVAQFPDSNMYNSTVFMG